MASDTISYKKGKEVSIKIDQELCVSVASCVAIAGNTFELDDNGLAVVKNPDGDPRESIISAAQSCPTKAISVFDNDGKKLWPQD